MGDWGQKFIGVAQGGALRVHGDFAKPGKVKSRKEDIFWQKLTRTSIFQVAWTRLTSTLETKAKMFESDKRERVTQGNGFIVYVFDSQGNLLKANYSFLKY